GGVGGQARDRSGDGHVVARVHRGLAAGNFPVGDRFAEFDLAVCPSGAVGGDQAVERGGRLGDRRGGFGFGRGLGWAHRLGFEGFDRESGGEGGGGGVGGGGGGGGGGEGGDRRGGGHDVVVGQSERGSGT